MHRILVLGASGFVGRQFIKQSDDMCLLCTYNRTPIKSAIMFDSLNDKLQDVIDLSTIRTAVLLLGDTDPESCTKDTAHSNRLNVESIKRIIDQLVHFNIKIIFSSSEFVYSGDKGSYKESDKAEPILLYGKQKLVVERYIQESSENHVIFRFAKIYGTGLEDNTLFTSWINGIENKSRIVCASDQYFSPVHVDNVIETLRYAIKNDLCGIYNLAGPYRRSRKELLELLIATIRKHRLCNTRIEACSIDDFPLNEKRPKDVSMSMDKLVSDTGIELITPDDSCRKLVENYYAS